jgi:hypothetical protein
MLKAKYYPDFKGLKNCALIIGDPESCTSASSYYRNMSSGPLMASGFIRFENENEFGEHPLIFTKDEYLLFAEILLRLADQATSSHEYFGIESEPDIEFLISCGEYGSLP